MTLTYTYDGAPLPYRVAPANLILTSLADRGESTFGGVPIEDPGADLTLTGHRPFHVEETDCSQPRLFTGFVTQRDIGRLPEQGLIAGPDARIHDTTIIDLNALFSFRLIHGAGGKRPAETWTERLTWLLGSSYLSGLIEDTGYVAAFTNAMDACDYRGDYPSAVMNDLLERRFRLNYFAFADPDASYATALFFDVEDAALNDSTLSISNDLDDVDEDLLIFAPNEEARLAREPDQTYSEVMVEYSKGRVYRSRASTAATYIKRGTMISRPHSTTAAGAAEKAEVFLDQHGSERDRISCTINVPSTAAGLVTAGQRMDVKFTHMPGYETWTSMRVISCTPKPCDNTAGRYDIALELVSPRAVSSSGAGPCPDEMASQEIPPNLSNVSTATGYVIYWCNSVGYTIIPDPFHVGFWNFPAYNVGGVDYAGDCVQNVCRIFALGDGMMVIHTAAAPGGSRPITVSLRHWGGSDDVIEESQNGISGEDFTFAVSTLGGTICTHYIDIADGPNPPCGGSWGFAGATWTTGDIKGDLGPPPDATTLHTVDPTVNDDEDANYTVGSRWINTTSGNEFVSVDSTPDAAVWVSTTVAAGAPTDVNYLVGTASGALSAEIVVGTTPGGELGGTWASPTVDATHSGSAHLALGSTGTTAAAGNHTHASARTFPFFGG